MNDYRGLITVFKKRRDDARREEKEHLRNNNHTLAQESNICATVWEMAIHEVKHRFSDSPVVLKKGAFSKYRRRHDDVQDQ